MFDRGNYFPIFFDFYGHSLLNNYIYQMQRSSALQYVTRSKIQVFVMLNNFAKLMYF